MITPIIRRSSSNYKKLNLRGPSVETTPFALKPNKSFNLKKQSNLFTQVFLKDLRLPKASKSRKPKKPEPEKSDFFYQLLFTENPSLEKPLKDLLCIAEIGIPQGDIQKQAKVYIQLGDKYYSIKKYTTALKFFKKSYKNYSKMTDLEGKSISLNRLSIVYFTLGKFYKAKTVTQKHQEICDEDFVPNYNLGIIYRAIDQLESSEAYFLKARSAAIGKNSKEELCFVYSQIGLTYKGMGKLEQSKESLMMSVKFGKRLKIPEILLEINSALEYLIDYEMNYSQSQTGNNN